MFPQRIRLVHVTEEEPAGDLETVPKGDHEVPERHFLIKALSEGGVLVLSLWRIAAPKRRVLSLIAV
jgi:hypothetical protein